MNKQAKKGSGIIIVIIFGIGIILYFTGALDSLFSITGSETVSRSAPSTVNPNSQFTLTYTVNSGSGTWGNSIVDNSGNCKFPDNTNSLKTVMLSSDGNTKSITITAPSSGSCTFTGSSQFGSLSVVNMANTVVNVCSASCVRPSNLCTTANTASNGCGGTCDGSWTIVQNTQSDTNCDNHVDRDELGVSINQWIQGSLSRTDLGGAIQAWTQN